MATMKSHRRRIVQGEGPTQIEDLVIPAAEVRHASAYLLAAYLLVGAVIVLLMIVRGDVLDWLQMEPVKL